MPDTAGYFIKRAEEYNFSSRWVDDQVLIKKLRDLAMTRAGDYVVDIGIGTGKIAQAFCGKVKYVAGVDICDKMVQQAKKCADQIILAAAEKMPFRDNVFDLCICRQGLQFMKVFEVLNEIQRVLKPGGHVVLCHLAAYGEMDKKEAFLIQGLRNPARKNFFMPKDVPSLLKDNNFDEVESFEYISRESVNRWIDSAAIAKGRREQIKEIYRSASEGFKKMHRIQFKNNDIIDSMKMSIVKARKKASNG